MLQILLIADSSTSFAKIFLLLNKLSNTSLSTAANMTLINKTTVNFVAAYIIDTNWRNILGDEWISNETTRRSFFQYMEKDQQQLAQQTLATITQEAAAFNFQVNTIIKSGKPENTVISIYREYGPFDLVILPHPTEKSAEGTIKINAEKVVKSIPCPVMIGPP